MGEVWANGGGGGGGVDMVVICAKFRQEAVKRVTLLKKPKIGWLSGLMLA